jgi:hypothetical protein
MKPMPEFLCVLLLAGAVAGAIFEQRILWKARADNQQLHEADKEAQRLAGENATIDRWRGESQEIQKLRNETKDLYKLRNEVRQLREQKPAWDRLRAENERLGAGAKSDGSPASGASGPENMIAKERLSDAGLGSPEAAIQTLFWALREGNQERARMCFAPEIGGEMMQRPDGPMRVSMDGFKGFRVVGKRVVSTDEGILGIQFSAEEGPVEVALPFKRVDGEWKINLALSP